MTAEQQIALLVIDDEDSISSISKEVFESYGYSVEVADSGDAGLSMFRQNHFDIVISDLKMPDVDGIEVIREIKRMDEHSIVFIMTGFATVDSAVEALEQGAFEYFVKPLNFKHMDIVMRRALTYRQLQLATLEEACTDLHGIVGSSAKINQVRAQIRMLARHNLTVLISGETGTGKEVVARAIHDSSKRKDEPFVAVNCGALPESLLESELFGHIRGAFTGAAADKRGLFEAAAGGTIFLDEIDSASAHTQAALLRVLDNSKVRPVGGTVAKDVDTRVLVATNKDLESLVSQGAFREDLFYRLISSTLTLPPLRERVEDIPAFVNHFVKECVTSGGKVPRRFSPKAIELMTQHSWPGNVRELKHTVQSVVMSSHKAILRPADLPNSVRIPAADMSFLSLREAERRHVDSALRLANWNKSEAARFLDVGRSTLYSLMARHGLSNQPAQDRE